MILDSKHTENKYRLGFYCEKVVLENIKKIFPNQRIAITSPDTADPYDFFTKDYYGEIKSAKCFNNHFYIRFDHIAKYRKLDKPVKLFFVDEIGGYVYYMELGNFQYSFIKTFNNGQKQYAIHKDLLNPLFLVTELQRSEISRLREACTKENG
jgi:hypothetical protein